MRIKLGSVFMVTMVYLLFGLLWIYFSDKLLDIVIIDNITDHSRVQTIKGFFYVAFTAVLLYHMIKRYQSELFEKVAKIESGKKDLITSEENYRLLFDASPIPIIIYQPDTEKILEVNIAALKYYGYTPGEFKGLSFTDIEDEEVEHLIQLEEKLHVPRHQDLLHSNGIHRHRKKDGHHVYVYMQGSAIMYEGKKAQIVMVNDITYQLEYIEMIEKQNTELNKIGWMQSHVVRAPLASLMGLIHLLKDNKVEKDSSEELCAKILVSAEELDTVIRTISDRAYKAQANISS